MEYLNENTNIEIDRKVQDLMNKGRKVKKLKKERKSRKNERNIIFTKSDNVCPYCKENMQRRSHRFITEKELNKHHYFKEWDYCSNCKFLKHYDEFKVLNPIGKMFEELEENKRRFFNI